MYHKSVAQKMRHCWNDVESLMKCYSSSWQGGIGGDWRLQWSCWYGRSRLGMLARRTQLWHLAEDGDIRNRWSGYYSGLLNETNPKEQLQNVPETAGEVAVEDIINQLAKRKGNKACDPDLIPNVCGKRLRTRDCISREGIERSDDIWHTIYMEALWTNTTV